MNENNKNGNKAPNWQRVTIILGAQRSFRPEEDGKAVHAAVSISSTLRGPIRFTHQFGWAILDKDAVGADGVVDRAKVSFVPIHHLPDDDGVSFVETLQRALTATQLAKVNTLKKVDGTLTTNMSQKRLERAVRG